ncbi:hypothetical protein SAMN02745166_04495 [Prosthecobacter debontii]|uniref:Uncharacterized protein n=1 Tax=Prosthecobacter debontii TaxID=48467 RepID=A0A1T4YXG7_9BACT|nr:hypothetical protein SAMN02745166_04495 [Prosthecobacter debontii]
MHTPVKALSSKIIRILTEKRVLKYDNSFRFCKKQPRGLTRWIKLFNLRLSVEVNPDRHTMLQLFLS